MASFSLRIWPLLAFAFALHNNIFFFPFVAASTPACYYPNGDTSTEDVPCLSTGGPTICCPLNWECMSDGLCYLANEGYYERHTCSDASWPDSSCPRICTQDMSAAGNEAMLWCATGEWCCDGNRSWNCCNTTGTNFFDLPAPRPFASISVAPSVSTSRGTTGTSTGSSGTTTSTSASPTVSTTLSSPVSKTSLVVTTGDNGATKTVTTVMVNSDPPTPTSVATAAKQSTQHQSNTAIIVGLTIGIPLVCILGAITTYLLYRHYRQPPSSGTETKQQPTTRSPSPPTPANYQPIMPGSHAPELGGYPVAETKSGRSSELYGSENWLSPALSTRTNGGMDSVISPVSGGSSPVGPSLGGTEQGEKMAHIPEEPQELWGGYVPYRSPQAVAQETGGSDGVTSDVQDDRIAG